jgi:exosortase
MVKNSSTPTLKVSAVPLVKAAAIVAAVLALFHSDLAITFADALQSETTSYMLIVPFIFAYFLYRKRKILGAVATAENGNQPRETRHLPLIAGILLFITAVMLYWYGSYTFTPLEFHMLALPIFASALTLIFFNPQTLRQLIFPIAFLAFLVPPPSEILYFLGSALSVLSAEASNAIVQALGVSSTITSEYGNPTIQLTRPDGSVINFTVDIACSGIYGLLGFVTFAFFVAYIIRDKTWKKTALIITGIPLIYMLNILRITIILLIGNSFGETVAVQVFHMLGGWTLIFLGTLLLLLISEKIFKTRIFRDITDKCQNHILSSEGFCFICGRIIKPKNFKLRKSDIAKIICTTLAVAFLVSVQAPVFTIAQTQPIIMVTTPSGEKVSTTILPQIAGYNLSFLYRDTGFEAKAKQDMSLVYIYTPNNKTLMSVLATIEIASARSSLHRWEVCLITWPISKGYQPRVNQIELKDLQLKDNPPVIGRYFAFNYKATGQMQAVLYWYETATFTVNATSQQKNVKISLIAYPKNIEALPETEKQLVKVGTEICGYWQPIKTWSQVTLAISQNGLTFTLASTTILAITVLLQFYNAKKQKRANANAYQKLSKINMQLIDIIRRIEKKDMATFRKIAEEYKKASANTTEDELLKKLSELERTGIIKGTIINKHDEPIKIWRTQI